MPNGQPQRYAKKGWPSDYTSQEQKGRANRRDGPSSKDKPQPDGLWVIKKALVLPAAVPVECVDRRGDDNCNRKNRWDVHKGEPA